MNKLIQVKHIAVLMFVVGIVPLSAMEKERRSPRLAEKRLAMEKKLAADATDRSKELEKTRRAQNVFAYDDTEQPLQKKSKTKNNSDSLDSFMLRPIMAEGFRKLVEADRKDSIANGAATSECRKVRNTNSNSEEEDQGAILDAVMLRPIMRADLAKVIARQQKDWKK